MTLCCMHGLLVPDHTLGFVYWQGAVEMQLVPGHFAGGPGGPFQGAKAPPDSGSTHAQIIESPDGLPNGRAHLVGLLPKPYCRRGMPF